MYLYVAETSQDEKTDVKIEVKKEITKEALEYLNSAFFMCSIYHSIEQIERIVVENGEDFKQYMSEQNLRLMRKRGVSPERTIMLANKYALNYASAIKTYIDMEKRLLKKHKSKEDVEVFEEETLELEIDEIELETLEEVLEGGVSHPIKIKEEIIANNVKEFLIFIPIS